MITALRTAIVNILHDKFGLDSYHVLAPSNQVYPFIVFGFPDMNLAHDTMQFHFKFEVYFNFHALDQPSAEAWIIEMHDIFNTIPSSFRDLDGYSLFGAVPIQTRIQRDRIGFSASLRFFFFLEKMR